MSEVHNTTAPVVEPATTEPIVAPAVPETPTVVEPEAATEAAPVADATTEAEPAAAATETAPVAEEAKTEAVEEKVVEPISEGQLAYKGPGLVKSLIPSKKEFWLNDAAVEPQNLHLFLRGEKPEVAHPIAAWASQTGKGLLFVNKKSDTDRTHPSDVLPLYDASDLKKESPHQFSVKINAHTHTFKATTDAERDGWYLSIEKAIELAKASKEEVQASEGYKAELEKLSKPAVPAVAAGKVKKTETEETEKKQKSRSTSRGLLNRLKGNKEETAEEKKEESKEEAKEEAAAEPETAPVGEVAPVAAAVPAETTEETPVEAAVETPAAETKAEEKPKPAKRGSIFGKVGWASLKSPSKEKEQKEAELGAAPVSENPPVLPETATTEPAAETAAPVTEEAATDAAVPATEDAPATETVSPTKEKTNFLSSFIKRSRSVSPSTALAAEEPKKEEVAATPIAPVVEESAEAPVKAEEPVAATEEKAAEETRPEATKRQSVLGSLGRRASKAFKGIQPKKETTPVAEATKEESELTPATEGEVKAEEAKTDAEAPAIADVVPEAVSVGQPQHTTPTVAASA